MAFLRVEKKQSGTYLRIIESYKESGKSKHRTLHSLGKVEDYSPNQLEAIAKKTLRAIGYYFGRYHPLIFPRSSPLQLRLWSCSEKVMGSISH